MIHRIRRSLRNRYQSSSFANRVAHDELRRERAGGFPVSPDPEDHLRAAVDWVVRAQDATPDDGIARAYTPAWNNYFELRGWQASYPETTGYLIPTLYDAAARLDRPELRERARRAADWEIEVQLASGAVQGGILGERPTPTPAVFNTGQVILGWLRTWRETAEPRFLEAARRAGDFLVASLDDNGVFQHGESSFARSDATSYNTRVSWSLCLLGRDTEDERYTLAGERHLDRIAGRQLTNGWFPDNCLDDPERPLVHTIAYATRGLLESGLVLKNSRYLDAAHRCAVAVSRLQRPDGSLAGRYDRDWQPAVEWSCLTGNAQMSIIWSKLAAVTGDPSFNEYARRSCHFVMTTQNRDSADPGIAGGIKGSSPFDGGYGRYEVLNWATKFFIDALLLTTQTERPAEPTP